MGDALNVLAIDIGGTHVKILVSGEREARKIPSGPKLTPQKMVAAVKKPTADWKFGAISIGYPGPVLHNRPVTEPHNLAKGWTTYDFQCAFKCPVKIMNYAAMQALGSYRGGKLLFLGLGTGLGTTMIVDGIVEPMEIRREAARTRHAGSQAANRIDCKMNSTLLEANL